MSLNVLPWVPSDRRFDCCNMNKSALVTHAVDILRGGDSGTPSDCHYYGGCSFRGCIFRASDGCIYPEKSKAFPSYSHTSACDRDSVLETLGKYDNYEHGNNDLQNKQDQIRGIVFIAFCVSPLLLDGSLFTYLTVSLHLWVRLKYDQKDA